MSQFGQMTMICYDLHMDEKLTEEQSDSGSRLGRIIAVGSVALGLAAAGVYIVANWHGIPLPPMHIEPIHSPDSGFVPEQVAQIGSTLLSHMQ